MSTSFPASKSHLGAPAHAATAVFGLIGPSASSEAGKQIIRRLADGLSAVRSGSPEIVSTRAATMGWFPDPLSEPPPQAGLAAGFEITHGRQSPSECVNLGWRSINGAQSLLSIARSGHGAIPLFWAQPSPNLVAFCTSDAVLQRALGRPLNKKYIRDCIVQEYSLDESLFRGIWPLPANSTLMLAIDSSASQPITISRTNGTAPCSLVPNPCARLSGNSSCLRDLDMISWVYG